MGYVSDEVSEAAARLGLTLERLPEGCATALRHKLASIYALHPDCLLTYCRVGEAAMIHEPTAWTRLGDFVGTSAVCLLFDKETEVDVWRLPDGRMVVPLLADTIGFVFYLTSADCDYLLYFDDHDCLIGLGKAAAWIRSL